MSKYLSHSHPSLHCCTYSRSHHAHLVSQVFGVYIVVLWVLTANNILAPVLGFGRAPGALNGPRTLAWLINVVGGVFLTIMGFMVILMVFPKASCTVIGFGLKAMTTLNLENKSEHACRSLHIIAWMDVILFSVVCLFLTFQLCIAKFLKAQIHRMFDSEGFRSIHPDSVVDFLRSLIPLDETALPIYAVQAPVQYMMEKPMMSPMQNPHTMMMQAPAGMQQGMMMQPMGMQQYGMQQPMGAMQPMY